MKSISEALSAYMQAHPIDTADEDCAKVLDQRYLAYANSHEPDAPEIQAGFAEPGTFLDGLQYDAHLLPELQGRCTDTV